MIIWSGPYNSVLSCTIVGWSGGDRALQSLFGKMIPYNPTTARKYYMWDTDTKIRELERAIKDARRDGQDEYAKRMIEQLKKVKKERR